MIEIILPESAKPTAPPDLDYHIHRLRRRAAHERNGVGDILLPSSVIMDGAANALKWAKARLKEMERKVKANEYALSQEANGTLCRCRYGTDMMGQVPEGSFCPFCGYRRYESVITGKWQAAAQQEKEE